MSGQFPLRPLLVARRSLAAAAALLSFAAPLQAGATTPRFEWQAKASAKVAYDDNVFLQDYLPLPGVTGASPARQSSLVTTTALRTSATWKPSPETELSLAYGPEWTRYAEASSESHTLHPLQLGLRHEVPEFTVQALATATVVDGSRLAPIYGCPTGAPVLGTPAVRDRRESALWRGSVRVQRTTRWGFVRPTASAYVQNFRTVQKIAPGYMNYIDRGEILAGLDLGARVAQSVHFVGGFRAGRQEQHRLHGLDSPYDSDIVRWLVGAEGKWGNWRFQACGGADTRDYASALPLPAANKHPLWFDASATWSRGAHSCTFTFRRQQLPSSASLGMYDDTLAEAVWRSQLPQGFTVQLGAKMLRGDWVNPNSRNDLVVISSAVLRYAAHARCEIEAGWNAETAENRLPGKADRDYRRNVVSAAATFKL